MDFSAFSVWAFLLIVAILLGSMLLASILKRFIPALDKTLIPVSVLGGIILLVISTITYYAAGDYLFNFGAFEFGSGYDGMDVLELITYHCLGIGFVAMGMRGSKKKFNKTRAREVFDSGVTTVNGYLMQAVLGLAVTIVAVAAFNSPGMIEAGGILLAFGFGQGTGQALNYGNIYEGYGLQDGGNFGLTVAAIGFLVACIGGVIYLNVLRRKGAIKIVEKEERAKLSDYEDENEISVVSSMDKFTVQMAIVLGIYAVSFLIMYALSLAIPSLESVLFGFNFLIGTLLTVPVKAVLNKLQEKKIIKKQIVNNFMMGRIGGFAFDLMIVAGVAAIRLPLLADYWLILLLLALFGSFSTLFYVYFVSKKLFPGYYHEQFLAMFGMLTGTASTGMILLREMDGNYRTPASENLVYQSLVAMVFGFPIMFLATYACLGRTEAIVTLFIALALFIAFNILLFRRFIFRKRFVKAETAAELSEGGAQDLSQDDAQDPSQDGSDGQDMQN